jgi:CubicO group peptidase (beta-lactamase class C family)
MSCSFLPVSSLAEVGINERRWQILLDLASSLVQAGEVPALSFQFQHRGRATPVFSFGNRSPSGREPVDQETRFLVASLTKPVLATGILLLVERGVIALNQRVVDLLPEFDVPAKRPTTVRHLLSHTSGLPDMLPNNLKLRHERAPLNRFVEGTCAVGLDYPPGRGSQYQSMGYALLGEILSRYSGLPYGQFLRENLFLPLGMDRTWLSLPAELYGQLPMAEVLLPEEQHGGQDWNWNSLYWHTFGAPWGGMIAPVDDLSRFLRFFLNLGVGPKGRLLSTQLASLATTNRLSDFEGVSEFDRRARGWGFGFRMNWLDHRGSFCELLPPTAYGHWGATGTLFWADPESESAAVLFSTQPLGKELSPLTRLSNAMLSSLD